LLDQLGCEARKIPAAGDVFSLDDKINKTLEYATLLPFAKTPEDELALFRELLG
jgi:hypothetical protein